MNIKGNHAFSKALPLLLAAALCLGGCGGEKGASSGTVSSGEASGAVQTDSDGRELISNVYKEGLPIVKDKVTLTTVVSTSAYVTGQVQDMQMLKEIEERTNVHIKIQEQIPGSDYGDKVNLMIAGGNLPDIFLTSIGEITDKYYNSGLFTPLDGLIAEWSPNYQKILDDPVVRANVAAIDNNVYATPFGEIAPWLDVTNEIFINTDWLKKLNLQTPTTLDDYYNMLKAFKEGDPNGNGQPDELPLVLRMKRGDNMLLPFFACFDLPINQDYALIENQKYVYGPQEQRFRDGLAYVHKLYADGLLDPESLTQGIPEMQAKGSGADQLMGSFVAFWGDDYCTGEGTLAFDSIEPLKSPSGKQMWLANTNIPSKGGMSITSACKNKEAAIRLADYFIESPYRSYEVNYGPESLGLFTTVDGKVSFNSDKAPNGITFEEWTRKMTIRDMIPYYISGEGVLEARVVDLNPQRKLAYNERYTPYLVTDIITPAHTTYFASEDEKQEAATIYTDLMPLVENFVADSLINGVTDDSWNTFQNTLKSAKIERYLELRQISLDHYYESIK